MEKEEIEDKRIKCSVCGILNTPDKFTYIKSKCNDCVNKYKMQKRREKKESNTQPKLTKQDYEERIKQIDEILELRRNIDKKAATDVFNELFELKNKSYIDNLKKRMESTLEKNNKLHTTMISNIDKRSEKMKTECLDEHELIKREFKGFKESRSKEHSVMKEYMRNIIKDEIHNLGLIDFSSDNNPIQLDDYIKKLLLNTQEENKQLKIQMDEIKKENITIIHQNEELRSFCNQLLDRITNIEEGN